MVKDFVNIRSFKISDYSPCAKIYQAGLATGIATFETNVPDWEAWDAKFLKPCRLVAENKQDIVGWCALTPFSSRMVYQGVAEVSVYIHPKVQGWGIGKQLLHALVHESEEAGFWTLQAKIFPQNIASIALHKNCGFRIVGTREKIGKRNGLWYDNIVLERRSNKY